MGWTASACGGSGSGVRGAWAVQEVVSALQRDRAQRLGVLCKAAGVIYSVTCNRLWFTVCLASSRTGFQQVLTFISLLRGNVFIRAAPTQYRATWTFILNVC